jgi:hypothetical protein
VKEKSTITEKIETCERLLDQAEELAYDGFYEESNSAWARAAEIAISLIRDNKEELFSDKEYQFLKKIINYIKEED